MILNEEGVGLSYIVLRERHKTNSHDNDVTPGTKIETLLSKDCRQ